MKPYRFAGLMLLALAIIAGAGVLSVERVFADPPQSVEVPIITGVTPNHGTVGTQVTITGLYFTSPLRVVFSETPYNVAIYDLPTGGGIVTSFTIPDSLAPDNYGRGQNISLSPGHHSMWLVNSAGMSNVATFTIDE